VLKKLDWAEPGDPPAPGTVVRRRRTGTTVFVIPPGAGRAPRPAAKPIRHRPVTREIEIELIRAYREDGDLDALEWLVGAHRPMVVTMAQNRWWGGNGTSLKALVEYGMRGLRLAAEPLRPSLTKKGELVGFDPTKGHRFSTYARPYAEKEMRAALSLDPTPERSPDLEAKADFAAEDWHRAPSLAGLDDAHPVVCLLANRPAYHKPIRPLTLWNPTQPKRKRKPRNYLKHPITETERDDRHAFYLRDHLVLTPATALSKDGMKGWDVDEDAGATFMVASSQGSRHVLKGKDYRVPRKWMQIWWKLGCKRLGVKIKSSTNQGLGSFNRYGCQLPD
jgi:hypothetical protein